MVRTDVSMYMDMQGTGGGKAGRQNPKSKITSLNSQLAELEAELAAVERDCAQLEEENRALLEQAQEREAEVERERAKIARTMPTATATGSVGAQATQVRIATASSQLFRTAPAHTTNPHPQHRPDICLPPSATHGPRTPPCALCTWARHRAVRPRNRATPASATSFDNSMLRVCCAVVHDGSG